MTIRKVRCAFTLLELMIVVTIIVLLVALLIPALKSAKDMGNSAACLSNLRQMGSLMAGYEGNYNGTIPGNTWYLYTAPYGGQWTSWDNYLQALSVGAVPIVQNVTSPIPSNLSNEKSFHCPSAALAIGATSLQYATYACNDSVCTNIPPTGGPSGTFWSASFKRINQITRPAEIIAAGDSNQSYSNNASWIFWDYEPPCISSLLHNTVISPNWTYTVASGSGMNLANNTEPLAVGPADTGMRYRHGERTWNTSGWVNVVFVDGHAESRGVNQVFARNLCTTY